MDNPEEFRCISLCTGYGGIELGLRACIPTLRTVCYVEVEAFACANLVAKMEAGLLDAAPVWTDIKTFDGRPFRKRVHIITAGYPCQGESCAGKRQGQKDPRWLWPDIERIIKAVQPVWFFGENVSGHLTLGFPTVYRSLRNLGYKVEAGLFTAAECGAPHRRERLFILAYNEASGRISKLADPKCSEQGQGAIKETSTGIGRNRPAIQHWPARPGQPQYEWEKPRVIPNAGSGGRRELLQQKQKSGGDIATDIRGNGKIQSVGDTGSRKRTRLSDDERQEISKTRQTGEGQVEPRLGGKFNGNSCRVDRLRLLGNGVVPQQAEKAFRELMKLIEANR